MLDMTNVRTIEAQHWLTRFGPKVGQIDPKWDKSGIFFSDHISVHFGSVSQNILISDLKKIPDHFGVKPDIPNERQA